MLAFCSNTKFKLPLGTFHPDSQFLRMKEVAMALMPFANCSWLYLPLPAHLCCFVPGREGQTALELSCPVPVLCLHRHCNVHVMICKCTYRNPVSPHYLQGFFCSKTLCCWPQGSLFHWVQCHICYPPHRAKDNPVPWLSYFIRKGLSKRCPEGNSLC